jgi:hypothetical protein
MNALNIFKNYPLEEDSYSYSSSDNFTQFGGVVVLKDIPDGGFPPIYICSKKEKDGKTKELESDEETKKRAYKTHKTAVSITSILEKRKKPLSSI